MPFLTSMTMFAIGATFSTLRIKNKQAGKKLQLANKHPEAQHQKLAQATQQAQTSDNVGEATLARSIPIAATGFACALAAISNPLFALPAAFISGQLAAPLLIDGMRKYKKHRHFIDLVDSLLLPTLVALNQLVAASLILLSSSISRKVLSKTYDQSRKSLVGILNTLPKKFWLLVDGVEIEVDYRHITPGDIVIVNIKDLVPVDGVIIEGEALLDQTMLTGEAVPAEKKTGDQVFAGTQVVSGRILVRLEKSGDATHAGEVSSLILNAVDRRNSVQERGERIAEFSLRPMLLLAGITGIFSGLSRALTVYFVLPGYTMRVLAPIALLQSLRASTEAGILVKDGRSLELLQDVDTVVFDKTGTLTDGELCVAQVVSCSSFESSTILSLAASAEAAQTHPIARAIINAAQQQALEVAPLDKTDYTVSRGIQASVTGRHVVVGSPGFVRDEGYELPASTQEQIDSLGKQGFTVIIVGIDQQIAGLIALDQVIRPEAQQAISALRQRGMQTAIISGDAKAATRHMATQLQIDQFYAETLPGQKAELIQKMQANGRKVCFVGDGINDAAALKQADVSVSIRGSSTIAVDTAQVVLVNANLELLNKLFDVAGNYKSVSNHITRLSVGLPLATLPVVLLGSSNIIMVLMAHNLSTAGGLWKIMKTGKNRSQRLQ